MENCIYLVVHDETCDTTDRTLNHYAFRELSAAQQCAGKGGGNMRTTK